MAEVLRQDVDAKDKWRLEDIYENEQLWKDEFAQAEKLQSKLAKFKGKLGNKADLLEFYQTQDKYSYLLMRLYIYASMRSHEDASVAQYQELVALAGNLMSRGSAATSYVTPELSSLKEEVLEGFIKDADFEPWDLQLKEVVRNKKYILSDKEEALLAQTSTFAGDFGNIFEMLNSLELDMPETTNLDGKTKVKLTHGLYAFITANSKDQDIRREAFKGYMGAFKKVLNTISLMYAGNVKKNWFYAKTRGYNSVLESALNGSNVPIGVYNNLIEAVDANVGHMHKYMEIRKRLLGLDKMHGYDTAVPVIEGVELKMPYDEAYELIIKSLAPMGQEYTDIIKQAKVEGWIDVYENRGKRSGAYQWGPYGTHPYVLLNYKETTRDIFTITHELGHALHSYYSKQALPISKASYAIFNAEVASTVNEVLLIRYLLNTTADKQLKKYLLTYLIDMFRSTLFTQTMFATFEKNAHEMAQQDKPLSEKALSAMYLELVKKYNGPAVEIDDETCFGWARIPHFYRAFYVYQYATGIISAMSIADSILKDGDKAVKQYKKFLSAGGSDYPTNILKKAGVDLTKKAPFEAAFKILREAVEELDSLTK